MPAGPHQIKFKPEVIDQILQKISKYIPYKIACISSGVSERNFYLWKAQGEKDLFEFKKTPHADFVVRLAQIEAHRIGYNIEKVEDNENGHKGAQWILERVFWKYFSPKIAEIELNERVENLERLKDGANADSCDQEEKLCDETEK